MSPSLNDLPDLCLLEVFQYLSLLELFRTIRLVSTRWSGLLPTELNRRRSLVIVDDLTFDLSRLQLDQYGSHLIEHVKRDDGLTPWARLSHIDHRNVINRNNRYPDPEAGVFILHDEVPLEMITTLVDGLPRIRNLTIVQKFFDVSTLEQIVRMIDNWREHLVSLKLCLYYEYTCYLNTDIVTPVHIAHLKVSTFTLFDSINRSKSLKHLTLQLDNFTFMDHKVNPPLTILSQLSTFHSGTSILTYYLSESLVRYASGNQHLQIGAKHSDLYRLLEIDQQFYNKIAHLQVNTHLGPIVDDLNQFCTRFTSLVYLAVQNYEDTMPMAKLARCISHLTQLVHLSAKVNLLDRMFRSENQELTPDQIVAVPSVRLFSLTIRTESHTYTEQLQLPELFPSVQVLNLKNINVKCASCNFNSSGQGTRQLPKVAAKLRKCAKLARRPFRRFPRLHTIEINADDSFILNSIEKRFITREEL